MRLLTVAAVAMGVLIVLGTTTLIVLVASRPAAPGPAEAMVGSAVLDQPAGTRIAGASGSAEALVLRLQGGGPDRVVVLDARTGRMLGRVALAR